MARRRRFHSPGRHRRLSHVRSILSVLVNRQEGITLEELASYLGGDASGLSRSANKLLRHAQTNDYLETELQDAHETLLRCLSSAR